MNGSRTTTTSTAASASASPLVLPLNAATDPLICGHKAATLAALAGNGTKIPPGFVVTAAGCRCEDAEALRVEVERALGALPGPVAVRSSAAVEDLRDASFAGQYETFLGVSGLDGVMDALRRCVASASSERVASYAGEHGLDVVGAPFAVLVQQMVSPDAAGVAFSADPRTGDDRVVISAARGLGDQLVSGEVSGDEWVVEQGGQGEAWALALAEHVLDSAGARRVAALARAVAEERGAPQDIEWAMAGGELYLLQARPITALPVRPELEIPTSGTWVKDTVHFPDLITPFGADVYLPVVDKAFDAIVQEFGLMLDGAQSISLGGEYYMRTIPPGGKDGPTPPWWLLAVVVRVLPSMRRRCRVAEHAIASGTLEGYPARWDSEWRPGLEREIAEHLAVDLSALDDAALLAELDALKAMLGRGGVIHFLLFVPYLVGVSELVRGAHEMLGWDTGRALELLSGLSTASSGPARALDELGALVAERPAAVAALRAGDFERLREADAEVADAFERYRESWGWRPHNYDPGSPALAERPGLIAAQLLDRMDAGARAPDLEAARQHRIAVARAQLREGAERARFDRLLAVAERVYPQREDNVRLTDNLPCGLIRRWLLEAGRRLHERGLLHVSSDAPWLRESELREALLGGPAAELAHLPERRRAEYAWVRTHPGPDVIGPPESAPPDLRGLPEAARRINQAMIWAIEQEFNPGTVSDAVGADGRLEGLGVCGGNYEGTVRVVRGEADFGRLRSGDVLVCSITTPAWSQLFALAGAVVTDTGSLLSHTAVVAREHGMPTVIATGAATRVLRDGERVRVDGAKGVVTRLR